MKKYRLHLLSLAHLPQSKTYMSCAYTQKNRKLAKMLTSLGHEVFFYGPEGSDVVEYCNSDKLHFIETHSLEDIQKDYGSGDNRFEIGYDWRNADFRHDFSSKQKKISTYKFYGKCIESIMKNKQPDDFLLCTQGEYHKPIADAVKLFLTCEVSVGYRGSVKGWWRAFESSYIQNYTYGYEGQRDCINGSYYDRVIPNWFDPDDIQFSAKKGDYYLFIGRMIVRKGILTAAAACNAIGKKLIIAGQGAHVDERGHLIPNDDPDFDLEPGTWEYVGYADVEKRKELMAHAIATFVPTIYLEIFGGVHIESMLSGTPPITTNFGVFPGTIPDDYDGMKNPDNIGVIGYKCNTLKDFIEAAKKAQTITAEGRSDIRAIAERYLTSHIKWEYQKWFDDLYAVYESAVDEEKGLPPEKRRRGWSRVSN